VSCTGTTPKAIGGGGSSASGNLTISKPVFTADGSAATGWTVTGSGNSATTVYVICAP